MRVCEIPHNLILNIFYMLFLFNSFLQKTSSIRYEFDVVQEDKKAKENIV